MDRRPWACVQGTECSLPSPSPTSRNTHSISTFLAPITLSAATPSTYESMHTGEPSVLAMT
eukprot:scaffold289171_cov30-Tisochrysis_lutea.AAC.1